MTSLTKLDLARFGPLIATSPRESGAAHSVFFRTNISYAPSPPLLCAVSPFTVPMLRLSRLALLVTLATGTVLAQTPPSAPATPPPAPTEPPAVGTAAPERFFGLFRPFQTDAAALSPDGKLLAYTLREGDTLSVVIVPIDDPGKALAKIVAGTAETSTPTLQSDNKEKVPARIRWMGWATPTRLILETNANLATADSEGNWVNTSGALFAVDATGANSRTLVTPRDVQDTKIELAETTKPNPDRITTPDVAPAEPAEATSGEDTALASSDDNLPVDKSSPRSPAFFDYTPGKTDSIIVRTNDPKNYALFTVNIHTGKLSYGEKETVTGDVVPLLNRQGLAGAAIPNTLRTSFPHAYLIAKKGAFSLGRWEELRKIVKTPATDFTLSPDNYLGERSFPLGFDENPDILYYASSVGRDTYGIYALNLKTGERTGKPIESPALDLVDPASDGFPATSPLVFDRYTRQLAGVRYQGRIRSAIWLRPEFQEVQSALEQALPHRSIDITSWDESAKRFLAIVRGPTDSGGIYIFDRETKKMMEFVRRTPWTSPDEIPLTLPFSFDNPAGGKLSGVIAIPRAVRQKPIPVVVMCADEPWLRAPAEFDNEMNALAMMGFAVLQVNPRGTWGFGARHRLAAREAFDEIQIADIVTAIDHLATGLPINPKRVAIMGHQRGGYLALRAVQLRPDRFRCAIGLEPTVNLASWLSETRWTSGASAPALTRTFFGEKLLKQNTLVDDARSIKRPVFVLAYRGLDGAPATQYYLNARSFASAVDKPEIPGRFFDLTTDYMAGLPGARSEVMRNIEDFLNENIYAYNVKMGTTEVIEDGAPAQATPPPASK